MAVHIEPLSQETLEQASVLANNVFPEEHVKPSESFAASLDPEELKRYQKEKNTSISEMRYFVACDESRRVLGTVGLYRRREDPDAQWVGWFCVDSEARGRKVGSALLDHIIAKARDEGTKVMRLYTSDAPEEADAQILYDRRGLAIAKIEKMQEGYNKIFRELEFVSEKAT